MFLVSLVLLSHKSKNDYPDAFASFPSGHSSVSFACMTVLSYYFHLLLTHFPTHTSDKTHPYRMGPSNQLWRYVVRGTPYLLAVWIAVSRIRNYWHRPEDVIGGAIIGLVTGMTTMQHYFHVHPRELPEQHHGFEEAV